MNEESRLASQSHYLAVCREKGWLSEDNEHLWPEDDDARTEMARGLFGLAVVSDTDSLFHDFRKQIAAEHLQANSKLGGVPEALQFMTDEQKTALLNFMDEFLDTVVHLSMLRLDRFDHGFIKLQLAQRDPEDGDLITDSEMDIISDDHNELFQDALQWKQDFSRGTQIGRLEPYRD